MSLNNVKRISTSLSSEMQLIFQKQPGYVELVSPNDAMITAHIYQLM